MKKWLSLLLALSLMLSVATAFADVTTFAREDTLCFNGLHWGAITNYNVFALSGTAFPCEAGSNELIYESLFMYNMLKNENEPLLADGPAVWEDGYNMVVKVKPAAKWSDGVALTADDVVFTMNVANANNGGINTDWSDIWLWLEKVEKVDDYTVRFTIIKEPHNVHMVPSLLAGISIIPEHVWKPILETLNYDAVAVRELFADNLEGKAGEVDGVMYGPIGSGPYQVYYFDDTRIICKRNDNYWGQDASMFGKLAEPLYLQHTLYVDAAAGNLGFQNGDVDVSQQFMESVWVLKEKMVDANGKSLVSTYYDDFPFQIGYGTPVLVFNTGKPGLNDATVRRAIALSLDYEAIGTNAMSGYSNEYKPSLFNLYLHSQYLNAEDEEYMKLRFDTKDRAGNIEKANAMLDEAGYADVDKDGFREMPDGSKLQWSAECPDGWTDFNASLEILCECAKKIGLKIETYFPESSVYNADKQTGNFEIVMSNVYPSNSVANPWRIPYQLLSSQGVAPFGEITSRNYGRYFNSELDKLIEEAAGELDPDALVEIYTEIDKIFMTEMPLVGLMYRPAPYHTTYEGVWEGFAKASDGVEVPPTNCISGAGIKDLYQIHRVVK